MNEGEDVRKRKINMNLGLCSAVVVLAFMCAFGWVCGCRAYADEKPPGDRSTYDVRVKQRATETKDGIREYRDKESGKIYEEKIPKTGHIWGEWKIVKRPTEDSDGYKERYCLRYGKEKRSVSHSQKSVLKKTGGEWKPWVVDKKPTNTEEGLRHRSSFNDKRRIQYDVIPDSRRAAIIVPGETMRPIVLEPGNAEVPSEADGNGKVIRHDVREDKRDANAPGTSSGESAANNGKGTGGKPVPFSAADAVIIGANGTMAGVWILILLPMFRVAVWVSAKKRAIRRKSV